MQTPGKAHKQTNSVVAVVVVVETPSEAQGAETHPPYGGVAGLVVGRRTDSVRQSMYGSTKKYGRNRSG